MDDETKDAIVMQFGEAVAKLIEEFANYYHCDIKVQMDVHVLDIKDDKNRYN